MTHRQNFSVKKSARKISKEETKDMKKSMTIVVMVLAAALVMAILPVLPGSANAATMSKSEFVELVANLAVADYPNSRILPSVVIAQAIIETGWGQSQVMMRNNALFGVKANASWTGGFYSASTGEYYGTWTTTTALFRAYPSLEACIADHASILSLSRYSGVVGGTDYVTVCNLLQSGGYATDPDYASKLISIIRANQLYKYDSSNLPGYNADKAVDFAKQWSQTDVEITAPGYIRYGADCANFVSQCLAAGGLPTNSTWKPYSTAWIRANELRQYLLGLGFFGRDYAVNGKGTKIDLATVSPGDIVWCTGSSGVYGHVMIVSEVTASGYRICGHTKERCNYSYTNNNITYHIKMNGSNPIPDPIPDPVPDVVTDDYIVHIDHPSGTYDGSNGVEISGWVASKIRLTSVMAQSAAIEGGQMNLTSGLQDASEELNAAGYSAYPYKGRFRGVIPRSGLTANTTYSFSVWMDLITGGQTRVTTSTFRVGDLNESPTPVPYNPAADLLNCIVHIDAPTGTYTNTDVEISGWIASMKPIGACMVESEAIPTKQYNLTSTLRDASSELDGAGYGQYPHKYRFSGAIPKSAMKSNTDYELKAWFNFTDGTSSGVTSSTFHTGEMKNTRIVITSPKGGSNYANNANVTISGYILANSKLWYILGEAGSSQYSFEGTLDQQLAGSNGYAYAYRFSKTIRCDALPANSNPTLTIWTKTADDGVETFQSVSFTTGARVYGNLNDYQSNLDSPGDGVTIARDTEITGWVAAHAPIAYVIYQGVPTDGSGGFQISCNIEPTSELDAGYSGYEYRARFRGILEYGSLKSNKTYNITIWCGLVNSSGQGEQKFLSGCGRTFRTGTVTKPVYTNTFNANGGTGAPAAVQKTWGTEITLPTAVPTRNGYTFLGWSFSAEAYEAQYLPGAKFREETSHTLYAVWEKATLIPSDTASASFSVHSGFGNQKVCYSITPFEDMTLRFAAAAPANIDLYTDQEERIGSGSSVVVNLNANRVYYVYARSGSASNTSEFTMSVTRGYPVTFDANGGTGAPSDTLYQFQDEPLLLPEQEPTREVVLTLNPNGGTLASASITLPAVFLGWSADEGVAESTVFNMPVTLCAEWEYPTAGSLEPPVRDGYELLRWVDGDLNTVTPAYTVAGDTTLTAIWQLKQYTITYDANGSDDVIGPTNKIHGQDAVLTTEEPTREEYDFVGWAFASDAAAEDYLPGNIFSTDADVTLYAVWTLSRIPVASLSLTELEFTIHVGETCKIGVSAEPEDADLSSITWSSLKPSVAAVDQNGVITGVGIGSAMIKAVCEEADITCYCRVTVTARSEITLPAQLTAIEAEAFMGNTSIVAVHVGDAVRRIEAYAFKDCVNLEDIWIPETVTHIALNAFDGCGKLIIHCAEDSVAWETALLRHIPFALDE